MENGQLCILVAGFSRQKNEQIRGNLNGHNVIEVKSFTDTRHRIGDKKYDVVILNADCFNNDQIARVYHQQREKDARTIAIIAEKNKRKPLVATELKFISLEKIARSPHLLTGAIAA